MGKWDAESVADKPYVLKSLVYGHKKTGKTIMAAMMTDNPLLVACDSGWTSLKDWPELHHVRVLEYGGVHWFREFALAVKNKDPEFAGYDNIIIDPVSRIVYDYVDWLVSGFGVDRADSRVHYVPSSEAKKAGEKEFATSGMNDYNAAVQKMRPEIMKLSLAPQDITYIAHVKDPSFTNPSDKSIKPNMPASLYSLLSKEVGIIGHMEAEGDKRTVSMRPGSNVEAGSWIRALQGKKVNAEEFPKMLRLWKEGRL